MLLPCRITSYSSVTSLMMHPYRRHYYSRSRFFVDHQSERIHKQTTVEVKDDILKKETINVHSQKTDNRSFILHSLGDSIINKLSNSVVDKRNQVNRDLKLINSKPVVKALGEIDFHTLKNASLITRTSNHNQENVILENGEYFVYKYPLINPKNSIVEIPEFVKFLNRITKYRYINSKELITKFIVTRVLKNKEIDSHLRGKERKLVFYSLLDFFTRNFSYLNFKTFEELISMYEWDTSSLNILLSNVLHYDLSLEKKMMLIDHILSKFQETGSNINKTTVYLIYSFAQDANLLLKYKMRDTYRQQNFDLTKFVQTLETYISENGMRHNTTFTSLIYKTLFKIDKLINENKKSATILKSLHEDSLKSMRLLPVHKSIEQLGINENNLTLDSYNALYLHTKYVNPLILSYLFSIHITHSKWKFIWDTMMSTMKYLKENPYKLPSSKSKQKYKMVKALRYTKYGTLFSCNPNSLIKSLNHAMGRKLLEPLLDTCNWQLFIRALNDINSLHNECGHIIPYKVYSIALNHLLSTDLKRSHLNPQAFLILTKYLIHDSLNSDLGPFKRQDILLNNLQSKVDNLLGSSFASTNMDEWNHRRCSARAELLNSDKKELLLTSIFDTNGINSHSKIPQVPDFDAKSFADHIIPDLISPNLSTLTGFECKLFKEMSKLRVLDSKQKVQKEYNEYSSFWDFRNINTDDILSQYHLGYIEKSYKHGDLKWLTHPSALPGKHLISNTIDSELKLNKLAKIDSLIHDDETNILKHGNKITVLSAVQSEGQIQYKSIESAKSLSSVMPNDWLDAVVDKNFKEWVACKLANK